MTDPRGILVAGALALVVTGAHAGYRSWPVTHGTEIYVPAALVTQAGSLGPARVELSISRIELLDVPHAPPAVGEAFEPMRAVGGWWVEKGDARANARKLRGRPLYVQLAPGQPLWPNGPAAMRADTVSDALVDGAINVAGIVVAVREDGYVWLDFSFGPIAVPGDVASHARPFAPAGSRRTGTGPFPPAADPSVSAVLRVLPSGRAALVGVFVNGTRY